MQDTEAMERELAGLKESCTALEGSLRELYEQFAFGELGRAEYLAAKESAAKKRDGMAGRIRELEAGIADADEQGRLANEFTDRFTQYALVEELTEEILSDVLEEIIIYPDRRIEIVWNYQEDLKRLLLDVGMEDSADAGQ